MVTRYTDLVDALFSGRLPVAAVHLDLPGLFAAILVDMGWPLVVVPPITVTLPPWFWLLVLGI